MKENNLAGDPECGIMVLTTGDEGSVGATRAIKRAGLADDSCTVGLGGCLAPAEFEKGSRFKATAHFSALEVGRISAEHMMMANGEAPSGAPRRMIGCLTTWRTTSRTIHQIFGRAHVGIFILGDANKYRIISRPFFVYINNRRKKFL